MHSVLLLLAAVTAALLACTQACSPCDGNMCCDIPANHEYFLTDFCGGAGTMSCGESCGYTSYYTADRQRFGCGKYLQICGYGKCLKAQVADAGPAAFVENDAGGPIIDASPQVCRYIANAGSCGWSDHFRITAELTAEDDHRPLGPFRVSRDEYAAIVGHDFLAREESLGLYQPDLNASICCTPDQYTGYAFTWDVEHSWEAGMNITYDYTGQRISTRIFERQDGQERRSLETIVLFKSNQAFTIDWNSQTCRADKPSHSLEQDCVPSNADLLAQPTIGGSLPAYLARYVGPDGEHVHETRAKGSCFPIETVTTHAQWGTSTTSFFDYVNGISNSSVFDVPSFCQHGAQTLEHTPLTMAMLKGVSNIVTMRNNFHVITELMKKHL